MTLTPTASRVRPFCPHCFAEAWWAHAGDCPILATFPPKYAEHPKYCPTCAVYWLFRRVAA